MKQDYDIRDKAYVSGNEVLKLNFINDTGSCIFRKYYRSGLRSHIFEVLKPEDVLKETKGEIKDNIRMFPRAKPKKIFRILRNRFENKEIIFQEIKKYNILLDFLGALFIAESEEFIVEYTRNKESQIMLCGLQEYVEGEILDPWRIFGKNYLCEILKPFTQNQPRPEDLANKARKNIAEFIKRTRKMINETGYIPDLAGIGNLVLTPNGNLKLVDINNIVKIRLNHEILIDDKGYPSCDVSVEVLSILEQKILHKNIHMNDPLYRFFLTPGRKKRVKALEKKFYLHPSSKKQ